MTINQETVKQLLKSPHMWWVVVPIYMIIVFFIYTTIRSSAYATASHSLNPNVLAEDTITLIKANLEKDIEQLENKIFLLEPKKSYMVINTAANEFSLFNNHQLVKKDKCSTGSYILLKNDKNQQWMFKTPKGEFKIRNKTKQPVWKKPDWAFIEDGLPVPSMNHSSRFEYGVLGDYSLALGDGYLIHGTLYQRFLGLPVTHGCIRLNDENLKLVFQQMQKGDKVFIF